MVKGVCARNGSIDLSLLWLLANFVLLMADFVYYGRKCYDFSNSSAFFIQGNHVFEVPDGYKMLVTTGKKGPWP